MVCLSFLPPQTLRRSVENSSALLISEGSRDGEINRPLDLDPWPGHSGCALRVPEVGCLPLQSPWPLSLLLSSTPGFGLRSAGSFSRVE